MSFSSAPIDCSPKDHYDYLVSGMAADDEPRFIGKGFDRLASQLGIDQNALDPQSMFLELGLGLTPELNKKGQRKLIQTNNGKHTTGIDVSLSAPKWFSVLVAAASEEEREQLLQRWDEHVTRIFNRLEDKATLCRPTVAKPSECERTTRQQGSKTERTTGELIAFIARHHNSRPTPETVEAGRPADVHIHSHIFLFNMAYSHGKWRAIDDYGIKDPRKDLALQLAMESEGDLMRVVEDMGYKPTFFADRSGRHHSKMEALADLCRHQSSRKRQEEKIIAEFEQKYLRPPNKDELRDRMLWERRDKIKGEERMDWDAWRLGVENAGLKIPNIDPGNPITRMPLAVRKRKLLDLLYGPQGLCGQSDDAVFGLKELNLAVARCAVGLGMTIEEQDEFRAELTEQLVVVSDHDKQVWTTSKNLDDEWYIHRRLEEISNGQYPILSDDEITTGIAEWETAESIKLDDEQRAIVFAALKSGLLFIEGFAGSGKTKSMSCAASILRKHSFADQVVVISTARDTAIRTGEKLNAEHQDSAESFSFGVKGKRIVPSENMVIFIDEAVMVDNDRMALILRNAGAARIVCIGDRKQLQGIGACGWYEDAVKRYGVQTLTKVWRQIHEEDIQALFNLRSGNSRKTFESLIQRDRVFVDEFRADSVGRLVADIIADRNAGYAVHETKAVLDSSNADIDAGNRLIQLDRINRGELIGNGYELHAEQTDRKWTIYQGDEVSFCTGYFNETDRVKVINGTRAVILSIDHEENVARVVIKTTGEVKKIRLDHEAFTQCLTPDYFVHVMRMQGGEAKIMRCLPGVASRLESGYSMTSRCIEKVFVYLSHEVHNVEKEDGTKTNPIDHITACWKTARPKRSARSRMAQQHARDHNKADQHLDQGPTRPMSEQERWAKPADYKPWLEDRKTRQFVAGTGEVDTDPSPTVSHDKWAAPLNEKPWLERKRKRRQFEVDGRGSIGLV